MGIFTRISAGLRALTNRGRVEREMDEELRGFIDASIEQKRRAGLTPDEAARVARIEMGSPNAVKHHIRSAGWETAIETLWQDTRFSLRGLAKSPGFTVIALLSLALGIGGNTAIFTLINQVLLRNLPVRNPEQLVTFGRNNGSGIAGGIDLGSYGLFPWYFTRHLHIDQSSLTAQSSRAQSRATCHVRKEQRLRHRRRPRLGKFRPVPVVLHAPSSARPRSISGHRFLLQLF